jgi:hypothetical protein
LLADRHLYLVVSRSPATRSDLGNQFSIFLIAAHRVTAAYGSLGDLGQAKLAP